MNAPPTGNYRKVALIVACALFMEQLDSTVLATALPAMARSFASDPLHMNIALTSYMMSLAVFIPASGRIADRLGSRTVFRGAIGLFTLGSLLCAAAPSLWFLVASRILQGMGGAMMVPVGRLVLLRTTAKADLVSAMAWLLMPATIGPIVGPPVGGFLVTALSWRWIFFINIPIGLLGIVLATLFIEQIKERDAGSLDVVGMVLSGIALSAITFGLEMLAHDAASLGFCAALLLGGGAAGALYARHARTQAHPILNYRLLRVRTFANSLLGGSFFRIPVGAVPFLMPLMLQLGFGFSAASSGSITFASSAGSLLLRPCAQPILRLFGFRRVLFVNGLLSSAAYAGYGAIRPGWPLPLIYAVLLAGGFFQSLQFTAYNTIAYADLPPSRMSAATSFYSTFQQLFLSFGITASAGILTASLLVRHHAVAQIGDFSAAFIGVAIIGLMGVFVALRLPPAAGYELSGHVIPRPRRD